MKLVFVAENLMSKRVCVVTTPPSIDVYPRVHYGTH